MPEEFGRYQLIELLGRGGMGEVHRAYDTVRDRVVALKVLPDYLAGDESFETRFRRESRMAAKLNEPHIIPIHDFGEIDGRLFIDMRLVEGRDLGSLVSRRGALPIGVAVDVVAQVASALDAAHASGLVHRDVKPSNILLTGLSDEPDNLPFAYLVDFGIARSAAQEGTALTATTATVGTVAYMSPERISGASSDLRTDVYALACVLYESFTGAKPFEGEMFAQMYAHMNTPPPAASRRRPEVPALLDAVIAKGMAKNPDERYLSAGAFASAARSALREAARSDTAAARAVPTSGPPAGTSAPAGTSTAPGTADPTGMTTPPSATPIPPPSGWTPPPPPRQPTAPLIGRPAVPPHRPQSPAALSPPFPTPTLPPRSSSRSHRTAVIAAVVVLVVAVGAAVAIIASRGSGSPAAGGSGQASAPTTRSSTGSSTVSGGTPAGPVLRTGSASTPEVSWDHFAAFSTLVGTRDGDTAAAFNQGECKLTAAGATDRGFGIRDEVGCSYTGSDQVTTVARFDTAAHLQTYLANRISGAGYSELVWTSAGQPRGLALLSPQDGTGGSRLTTSICGLPTYLVQIGAPDRTTIDTQALHDETWAKATFPDAVPAACDDTFRSARAGAQPAPSVGPAKDVLAMNSSVIEALAEQGDTTVPVTQVPTADGVEAVAVGQKGTVTFWAEANDNLTQVGRSTYPYSTSLGAPEAQASGAVLSGMTHVTFVVRGTFSGDGSGNAVAYTYGSKGWGAIKAQSDGDLAPSGQGVSIGGIGLGDDFALDGGRLETYDCSDQLPVAQCSGNNRIIKYWTWRSTRFVQTGSAGRSK